jgi:hypothetical protein
VRNNKFAVVKNIVTDEAIKEVSEFVAEWATHLIW